MLGLYHSGVIPVVKAVGALIPTILPCGSWTLGWIYKYVSFDGAGNMKGTNDGDGTDKRRDTGGTSYG